MVPARTRFSYLNLFRAWQFDKLSERYVEWQG